MWVLVDEEEEVAERVGEMDFALVKGIFAPVRGADDMGGGSLV